MQLAYWPASCDWTRLNWILYSGDRAPRCNSNKPTWRTILFIYIYFDSLHVSSNHVFIIRRVNCINTISGVCHFVYMTVRYAGRVLPDLHTGRSPTHSDIYQMLYWYNWLSWWWAQGCSKHVENRNQYTSVGTLIVATIYFQLMQNRYVFRSFTVLQCSHQHCVQPVASDVEVVGYL